MLFWLIEETLMKKIFTLIVICAIVTSCGQTGEQSKSLDDLDLFLASVEEDNLTEGPIVNSAYWIGSNFITYDSQKVLSDYSKRYTLKALELSREAALFNQSGYIRLKQKAIRAFEKALLLCRLHLMKL